MARTALTAPAHVVQQRMPGQYSTLTSSVAPDSSPSMEYGGGGLLDPRMPYNKYNQPTGQGAAAAVVGWAPSGTTPVFDASVPNAPAAGTGGIAPAANVTSGTPMALTTATSLTNGALITPSALVTMPFLTTIPASTVVIFAQMNYIKLGLRDITAFYDPTKAVAQVIAVTGVAGGAGGLFIVRGFDVYGQAMAEQITATAGATTVSGKKAWKWITSITPQFTDAHNYSFDVTNVFGLNIAVDSAHYTDQYLNGTFNTAPTVVVADTTNPATGTTGDVRGTIAFTPASNRATVFVSQSPARLTTLPIAQGLFGVTNFTQ